MTLNSVHFFPRTHLISHTDFRRALNEFWKRGWCLESSTTYVYFEGVRSRGVLDSVFAFWMFNTLRNLEVRGVAYFNKCFPRHLYHIGTSSNIWSVLTRKARGFFYFCFTLPSPSPCLFIMRQGIVYCIKKHGSNLVYLIFLHCSLVS